MAVFPSTRWSLIQTGQRSPAEARAGWNVLIRAYQPVILAFFRRSTLARDADDLAQDFILRSISDNWWSRADPEVASFRTFLLVLLRRFLAQQRDLAYRRLETAESGFDSVSADSSPEHAFDLQFALCLTQAALSALQEEYLQEGRGDLFAALQGWLLEPPEPGELLALGQRLQVPPNTLAVQLKRLRLRLQRAVRAGVRELSLDAQQAVVDLDALRQALAAEGVH
ncbi:MAG: hypothetical protein SGI99_16175 [Pseudomonadota bacterium]|nr:hypothetical protein [Pseudomonadota bacterium]